MKKYATLYETISKTKRAYLSKDMLKSVLINNCKIIIDISSNFIPGNPQTISKIIIISSSYAENTTGPEVLYLKFYL
jgi:hypothetical protein